MYFLGERLEAARTSGSGVAVAIRGRHQVGKSRLVQEFCADAGVPYLYYMATRGAPPSETVRDFLAEVRESVLPRRAGLVPEEAASGWPGAFRALAAALPDSPSIVVLDEYPWLAEQDISFDSALQGAWDRLLSQRPVLLLLLGSDAHRMDGLTANEGPLGDRAGNLVLSPLNPAEVGAALSLDAADAIDAQLISGGLPGILRAWPAGVPALEFAEGACEDPASPLFGVPEAALMTEFPAPDTTRRVIEAIGGGSRTHAAVATVAGSPAGAIPSGTLSPLLNRLITQKRALAIDEPLSTRGGKPALFPGRGYQPEVLPGDRAGGPGVGASRAPGVSGRAGAPSLDVMAGTFGGASDPGGTIARRGRLALAGAIAVGGWWTRSFETSVGLIGADRAPGARVVFYAGSIMWRSRPFDDRELSVLRRDAPFVPGFDPRASGLVAVSLGGFSASAAAHLAVCWGPQEVVAAYQA